MFSDSGEILADGELRLRRMRDEPTDYALVARWLSDARVLEWVEGRDHPYSLAMAQEKYGPRARGEVEEEGVEPCIIEWVGVPVGYLQFYPVGDPAEYELEDGADTWGIDLFIGEPVEWSKGIGSRLLRELLRYLFADRAAVRVVIDPRVENARAIRAYEKAGFVKVNVLPGHEEHEGAMRDGWLMEALRPA